MYFFLKLLLTSFLLTFSFAHSLPVPASTDDEDELVVVPVLPSPENNIKEYAEQEEIPLGLEKASELLLANMNLSADPCDDFFAFACGKFLAEHEIPPELTSVGPFVVIGEKVHKEMNRLLANSTPSTSEAINKVKTIYSICMDEDRLNARKGQDLLDAVEDLGYWPMLHGDLWQEDDLNLTEMFTKMDLTRGSTVLFGAGPSIDMKNVSRRLLLVGQGGLGLGRDSREYYLNQKYAGHIKAYKNFMNATLHLLAEDGNLTLNETQLQIDIDDIVKFETELAQILMLREEKKNQSNLYNLKKLKEVQELLPVLNWKQYFMGMMPPDVHHYFDKNPDILVTEPVYLKRLTKLLNETETRVIVNYLIFRYSRYFAMELGLKYREAEQEWQQAMFGNTKKSPRWKDCTYVAMGKLVHAASALYVRNYVNRESKNKTLEMIRDIKEVIKKMLQENDWMDERTKTLAIEKAEEMLPLIGYPEMVFNDTKLDRHYENLTVNANMTLAEIKTAHVRWGNLNAYRKLLKPVERNDFADSAATVNAFNSLIKNAIKFPAAILQPPFFDKEFPKAVNYASLGGIIGHEITHGFDDTGSQFDKLGNVASWWEEGTRIEFENLTKCLVDQYSAIRVPDTCGHHINGNLTLGENIADNGGVKAAFRAYQRFLKKHGPEKSLPGLEKFSNEQIFFIAFAQPWCSKRRSETQIRQLLTDTHAPSRFRVNLALGNQPEFAAAFSCPVGSALNPETRCSVW